MKYKALFISDVHLGSHKLRTKEFLDFLQNNGAETIYLIGDLFDGDFENGWRADHYLVLQKLLMKAHYGARIIYIPGNHDAIFRKHLHMVSPNIHLMRSVSFVHEKKTYLITHGDETDMIRLHFLLRWIGRLEYWTHWHLWEILRKYVRCWVEHHARNYKIKISKLAAMEGYNGVICGHIHHPEIEHYECFSYLNCGDWTYNCTAIGLNDDGFELIKWGID
jgi:UDP-2,3-diacylglucosamine pyrophosphatase LpxH